MAITNGYATLTEIKAADVLNFSNTDHDTILEAVIEAVSRNIDNFCGRHFYQDTSAVRYFTPEHPARLDIDDVYTTSGFTLLTDDGADGTYENTWATTDYNLLPANAIAKGWPVTSVEITLLGNYRFPAFRNSVKITANWGWTATPKPVNRACVLQSVRLFKRYITPLGVSAASAVGEIKLSIPALDPDVTMLLRPYVRYEG